MVTIKVKNYNEEVIPQVIKKGEWIDLYTASSVRLLGPYANTLSKGREYRDVVFDSTLVSLGVAMKLPDGYEAVIAPRSSTFTKYGLLQTNGIGLVDNSYSGNDDVWKLPVIATRNVHIPINTRLCQFRIQLSQKATIWQKLKWLFSSSIKLKSVDNLDSTNRGGFGSTGI